jgi:hypothetical protein
MIGGWFIPGANLIIPKMAFGELEKIAKVPYGGVPIGDRWKRHTRSQIGDLWWFMWASGSVIGWITTIATNVSLEDNGSFSAFLTTSALATLLAAVSGIPFIMAVRSIERDASQ